MSEELNNRINQFGRSLLIARKNIIQAINNRGKPCDSNKKLSDLPPYIESIPNNIDVELITTNTYIGKKDKIPYQPVLGSSKESPYICPKKGILFVSGGFTSLVSGVPGNPNQSTEINVYIDGIREYQYKPGGSSGVDDKTRTFNIPIKVEKASKIYIEVRLASYSSDIEYAARGVVSVVLLSDAESNGAILYNEILPSYVYTAGDSTTSKYQIWWFDVFAKTQIGTEVNDDSSPPPESILNVCTSIDILTSGTLNVDIAAIRAQENGGHPPAKTYIYIDNNLVYTLSPINQTITSIDIPVEAGQKLSIVGGARSSHHGATSDIFVITAKIYEKIAKPNVLALGQCATGNIKVVTDVVGTEDTPYIIPHKGILIVEGGINGSTSFDYISIYINNTEYKITTSSTDGGSGKVFKTFNVNQNDLLYVKGSQNGGGYINKFGVSLVYV